MKGVVVLTGSRHELGGQAELAVGAGYGQGGDVAVQLVLVLFLPVGGQKKD